MTRIIAAAFAAAIFFLELPVCIAFIQSISRNMGQSSVTHRFSMSSPESLATNGKPGFRTIASAIALSSLLIPSKVHLACIAALINYVINLDFIFLLLYFFFQRDYFCR